MGRLAAAEAGIVRMDQLQDLGDEFDVDQSARRSFTSQGPCGRRSRSIRARIVVALIRIRSGSC